MKPNGSMSNNLFQSVKFHQFKAGKCDSEKFPLKTGSVNKIANNEKGYQQKGILSALHYPSQWTDQMKPGKD